MNNHSLLGPWVRRFLTEHLVSERNYSVNTQRSYRDTLVLLIPFLTRALRKMPDGLAVLDLTEERIKSFLVHLEDSRHCRIRTRNQRLSAIRSLAHFVGMHSPEHIDWSGQIRSIPIKKSMRGQVSYLEKPEMNALLETPDSKTKLGLRDHTILLFLYNSGARADEVAQLTIADLNLAPKPQNGLSSVRLLGKGRKVRLCPLWPKTASALAPLVAGRPASERVFLNRCGQPFTRFGVHALVKRHAVQAKENMPSLAKKQLSPHTLRHTTATHLWRGGVDINTIRDWLGHVSVDTTNIYAETGLEMKAQALARCGVDTVSKRRRKWKEDAEVMAFLRAL